jgi:hypothetical protein
MTGLLHAGVDIANAGATALQAAVINLQLSSRRLRKLFMYACPDSNCVTSEYRPETLCA